VKRKKENKKKNKENMNQKKTKEIQMLQNYHLLFGQTFPIFQIFSPSINTSKHQNKIIPNKSFPETEMNDTQNKRRNKTFNHIVETAIEIIIIAQVTFKKEYSHFLYHHNYQSQMKNLSFIHFPFL
jgi:hypothetical protein